MNNNVIPFEKPPKDMKDTSLMKKQEWQTIKSLTPLLKSNEDHILYL